MRAPSGARPRHAPCKACLVGVVQCSIKSGCRIDKPAPRVYRAASEIFSVQEQAATEPGCNPILNKEEVPMKYTSIALAALAVFATAAHAAPAMMSAEWTAQACDAWNKDATLTNGLAEKWIKNDAGRGYKIIHMYRTDCGEATQTEMKIVSKDGKAMCVYGGAVQNPKMDYAVDCTMHATSERWGE